VWIRVHDKRCFVMNIYSKCDLVAKKVLWESFGLVRHALGEGAWCLIGEFNFGLC